MYRIKDPNWSCSARNNSLCNVHNKLLNPLGPWIDIDRHRHAKFSSSTTFLYLSIYLSIFIILKFFANHESSHFILQQSTRGRRINKKYSINTCNIFNQYIYIYIKHNKLYIIRYTIHNLYFSLSLSRNYSQYSSSTR